MKDKDYKKGGETYKRSGGDTPKESYNGFCPQVD